MNDPALPFAHSVRRLAVADAPVPMCTPTTVGVKLAGPQTSKAEIGVVVPMPSAVAVIAAAEEIPPVAVIRPVDPRVPPIVMLLVMLPVPATCNIEVGAAVPIPTPVGVILIRSDPAVAKRK